MSGNVLINEKADRLSSYIVWDYAEGHDSYYRSMLVDLTQPPDKVSDFTVILSLLVRPEHSETKTEAENNETETSIVQ